MALLNYADAVGLLQPAVPSVRLLLGSLAGLHAAPELRVRGAGPIESTIDVTPEGDLWRFTVTTNCRDACQLVIAAAGQPDIALPWQDAVGERDIAPGLHLSMAFATDWDSARASTTRRRVIGQIAAPIARAYAVAMPALVGLGVVGLALAIIRRRVVSPDRLALALALASVVAVVCRVGLLAYLDATSIPSVSVLYTAPASPFVILLAVAGCGLGWRAARRGAAT